MKGKKTAVMVAATILKISIALVFVILVYKFSFNAYEFGYRVFAEEPVDSAPGRTMSVAIVEGKSVSEIGDILEEKGLIRDSKLFYFQEMFSEYKDELQPGVYEFSTAMTPYEMMQIMAAAQEEDSEEQE